MLQKPYEVESSSYSENECAQFPASKIEGMRRDETESNWIRITGMFLVPAMLRLWRDRVGFGNKPNIKGLEWWIDVKGTSAHAHHCQSIDQI